MNVVARDTKKDEMSSVMERAFNATMERVNVIYCSDLDILCWGVGEKLWGNIKFRGDAEVVLLRYCAKWCLSAPKASALPLYIEPVLV